MKEVFGTETRYTINVRSQLGDEVCDSCADDLEVANAEGLRS